MLFKLLEEFFTKLERKLEMNILMIKSLFLNNSKHILRLFLNISKLNYN